MTRHPIRTRKVEKSEEIKQPMRLYAKRPNGACEPWCSCACHAKTVLRLKQPDVVGSFSVAYSGLPWVTASCDQKSCRSRSITNVAVTVQFPAWFWKRYWSSSFSYTAIRGPEINVKMPRTVSWLSDLWRHGVDGNLRAVQDLFSQGLASPWDVQGLGGSLLHYATDHGHWKLCKFLVDQGAMLENEDSFNNSPASLAWGKVLAGFLTEDEESMVANMFNDTDYLQTRQFTILHKIVLRLIPRTIQSELAFSTRDLDAVDSHGRTCVSWAAERGDADALKTLLQFDANVNLPDGQGNTPLHYVRNNTCVDILLAAGADITARNSFGHTPLHMVCRGAGSLPLLKRLIEGGININATDHSGETALCTATFGKHAECALHLIQHGADIDMAIGTNGLGDGPIHMAVISDVPAVLKLLLASNAKYTRANLFGRTILHYAAGLVCEETIQVLTSHGLQGIDVNIRDSDGKTAKDLLNERGDDDSNPDFKVKFHKLLDTISAAQYSESPNPIAIHEPELTIPTKAALEVLKDGSSIHFTPLSAEDENDCYEDDEFYEDSYDTHGAPMFYDALEEVTETLRVVDVTV